MPVRIYDIARKLGIESKDVLAKAKDLGIAAAKVPSSSLDKITAEYLEETLGYKSPPPGGQTPPPAPEAPPPAESLPPQPSESSGAPVLGDSPAIEAPVTPAEPEAPAAAEPPTPVAIPPPPRETPPPLPAPTPPAAIVFLREAKPVAEPVPEPIVEPVRTSGEAPAAPPAPTSEQPGASAAPETVPVAAKPPAPPVPVAPPAPRLGDKVGFIKLPPKPAPRAPEPRGGPPKPAPTFNRPDQNRGRPGGPGRPQYQQGGRPGGQFGARPQVPAQGKPEGYQKPVAPQDRFVPPSTGAVITLKPPVVVRDLAEHLNRKPFQLIADLMELNVFANVNQAIDEITAQKLCAKYGFRFEVEKRQKGEATVHTLKPKVEVDPDDKVEDLRPRAPVVTIMGHVDHGKTTLLDVIRKANVAAGEAGGITQHIGAYTISVPHPDRKEELQQITFLDTPGHAAFSSMRARGANVTDVVVLVVAANDGVMPQTLEALSHAQAARVPIIVAVNKVDHPNANPMKVRQQLQEKGLVCEEWGGTTIFVDVSALTKKNIDQLLALVVLQAEVLELKANPNRRAKGNIIESGLEQGGPTATVLVRKGTLRVGDSVVCGEFYGKVRALINEEGNRLKEAGPSVAVRVLGLNGVPEAGIEFVVTENEKAARDLAEKVAQASKSEDDERRPKVTLENLFATLASEQNKALRVVVKADTQGSVEAIVEALKKLEAGKVALEIIHSAVGTITESDVLLASASKAIVLGFHTRIDNNVSEVAKREAVQIKLYSIIYELIDQVRDSMAGLLDPIIREVIIGSAEVRQIFALSKGGNVAGCAVTAGRIVKGKVRVMRRRGLIFDGLTSSLRRFQDEVSEVRLGMECGIRLDGFNDFQVGDVIDSYTLEKVAQKI